MIQILTSQEHVRQKSIYIHFSCFYPPIKDPFNSLETGWVLDEKAQTYWLTGAFENEIVVRIYWTWIIKCSLQGWSSDMKRKEIIAIQSYVRYLHEQQQFLWKPRERSAKPNANCAYWCTFGR